MSAWTAVGVPVIAALLAGIAVATGVAIEQSGATKRQRLGRQTDAYSDAVAVLGAYRDHYRTVVALVKPHGDDPIENRDLHRVQLLVNVYGSKEMANAYSDAMDAAQRFHGLMTDYGNARQFSLTEKRGLIEQTERAAYDACDRFAAKAARVEEIATAELRANSRRRRT